MTEPRAGDSASESQRFPLPPFMPTAAPLPPPAPSPSVVLPPFSTPPPPAPGPAFATEPPPLPWEIAPSAIAPELSVEPPVELTLESTADELDAMPWEMIDADEPPAIEWVETAAASAVEELPWLVLDDAVEEPLDLAELAPTEAVASGDAVVAEADAEEAPAWLSWIGGEDEMEESALVSDELDVVEVGDLGTLHHGEPQGAPVSEAVPELYELAEPALAAAAQAGSSWTIDDEVDVEALLRMEDAVDEPTADEPTVDEPTADEPTADEPTADEPTVDEPTAPAAAPAVVELAEAAPSPFGALAARLERLAGELRRESPAALLAGTGRDPLEVLILGYALGQLHGSGENGAGH